MAQKHSLLNMFHSTFFCSVIVHDTVLNHTHQLMKIKFMAEILHEVYSRLMNITKHSNELCSLLG